MTWFWFSFVNDAGKNIGCTICDGTSIENAHRATHMRGINPGGEMKAMEMVGCTIAKMGPYVPYKLYTMAELRKIGPVERF